MMNGHLYMLLALLSFSTLGVFHKLSDVRQCRPSSLTAMLYIGSLVMATLMVVAVQQTSVLAPSGVFWLALPFGMSAAAAILAFQAGIRHGNIATSWLAINLSSGIPTIASIVVYDEPVKPLTAVALLLIPVAMLLLWKDKKDEERRERER
jgi:drug/metabolite transporter (DMT)-like permease